MKLNLHWWFIHQSGSLSLSSEMPKHDFGSKKKCQKRISGKTCINILYNIQRFLKLTGKTLIRPWECIDWSGQSLSPKTPCSHGMEQIQFTIYCNPNIIPVYKWPSAWQNLQKGMWSQRRLRSAWASACALSFPLSTQRRLWSDWADAWADLSLR